MNNKLKFPLNFIKKNHSYLFWLSLEGAIKNIDTDPEKSLKWLRIVSNYKEPSDDHPLFQENDFMDEEISDEELSNKVEFVMGHKYKALNAMDSAETREKVNSIIKNHLSKYFLENKPQETTTLSIGGVLILLFLFWVIRIVRNLTDNQISDLLDK